MSLILLRSLMNWVSQTTGRPKAVQGSFLSRISAGSGREQSDTRFSISLVDCARNKETQKMITKRKIGKISKPVKRAFLSVYLLISFLFVATTGWGQALQKATGGAGQYRNQIWWMNFTGVDLSAGQTMTRNFTVNGITITVVIDQVTERIIGYKSGSYFGDGLDDLYNIGGSGLSNTLTNAIINYTGATTPSFRFRAYATLNGQPMRLGLVFASAEDDADHNVLEYSQGTTNGSSWQLLEHFLPLTGYLKKVTFSSNDSRVRLENGSISSYPTATTSGPGNVALMYTGRDATNSGNPLTVTMELKGMARSGMAVGLIIAEDYGDAPTSYGVASHVYFPLLNNGNNPNPGVAQTTYLSGPESPVINVGTLGSTSLYLGNTPPDADANQQSNTTATGDDQNGIDDEDGIAGSPPLITACQNSYSLAVSVHNTTGSNGTLGGWIDFNRNGTFDPGEFASTTVPNNATSAVLHWSNLQNQGVVAGQSYIRLRLSTQSIMGGASTGTLSDGEVEDYAITILPALQVTALTTNASACATTDGVISLTATGGTGNYQYSLNGGAFTTFTSPYTIPNLTRGGYTIIVRNVNATTCADTIQVAVNADNCCDFNQLQPISVQAYNPGTGFTVQYVLTSTTGEILVISNTPSFPAQAPGSYYIRILVYNTASPVPTGVTVGQNVSGIRGCCFQLSAPTPIGICECPTFTLLDNNYQVCTGQNLALLRVTTSAAAPTQVEFVYFTTPQTSASAIYGGGTVLGNTTPVSNVAQLSNVSFPSVAGTYYVYARLLPAPADPACRPYAQIPVNVTTPDPGSDIIVAICNNETVDLATYFPGGGSFSAVTGSLTGSVFSGISSGVGSFTVVYTPVSSNCSAPATTIIVVRNCTPPPCDFPLSSAVVDASCGSSDGRVTVSLGGLPTGATVGYAWSNGKTGPSVSGLTAGVYSVTATISTVLGTCTVVDRIQVNEIGGPVAEISLVSAADCLGATGAVAINVKSGTGPFRIVWSGTASGTQNGVNLGTTTITNLAAGQYTFEIVSTTNNPNCSAFLHVTIPQDDSDQITLTATPTNATACGSPTGSITITASPAVGVTGPFSFSLNGVQIGTSALPTYTINGLVAGSYTVGVSATGGCSAANVPVTIEETGAPAIVGWAAIDPTCPTDQGQLTFTGGQPNSTFKIREATTGALLATVSGATATMLVLPAGTYSIEQTTAGSNCKSLTILTINRPEGLDFNVQYTKVTCAPGGVANTDGSISIVQISGGTPPYTSTVLDSQQQLVSNLQAVAAGVYTIQVVDSKGCRGVENVFVTVPDCEIQCPVVPMNTFVVDANCTAADGRAVAQLGSYDESEVDYQWSNNYFGKNTNGLASGVYSVTATILTGQFIGCAYVETVNVNQIGGPIVSPGIINPSSCASNTGSVSFSITGGDGPFTVSWSGAMSGSRTLNGNVPFQFTQSGLAPGDYVFTFKGADSECVSTLDVNIPVTSANDINLVATPNPTSGCGAQDGSILLTASGSGPTYVFSLNGVAYTSVSVNTALIPNLPAGVYTVGVKSGANGCETKQTVIIKETGAPEVTGWTSASALCASETGSLTYSGGTGSGTYRVLLGAKVVATTPANASGPITHNLPQGVYAVEFKDGACTSFQNFTITGPKGIDFNVQYVAETCGPGGVGNGDGSLRVIQITGGTGPYTVSIIDQNGHSIAGASHTNLLAGNYYVSVADANGCRGNEDALVTVPPCDFKCPPLAFNTVVVDNQCGETNGQATASLLNVPAGATATYLWSNGQNGPVATGLISGVYSVSATLFADNTIYAGCVYVDTINVNDIGGPVVTVSATSAASCTTANGSVALNIQGGTGPYTIAWTGTTTGSQTAASAGLITITTLKAGNYVFTVTDANSSCKSVIDVVIPTRTPNGFTLAVNPTVSSSCAASDGKMKITVSGGTGPFTYSVNGFVKGVSATRTFSVQGLPAGVYAVEVMDANGCVVNKENVLINPSGEPAIAGWSGSNAQCASDNATLVFGGNGVATDDYVVTIAGTATEIGRTAGNVAATYNVQGGVYLITRTTTTGCTSVTTVTVTQPDGLDFNIQYQNPSCASPVSGSLAVVQPNGGTAPYSYTVTGVNGVVTDLTALSSGSYTVTLGDSKGCTFSQVVTLTGGANLTITAAATPGIVCINQPITLSANATGGTSPLVYVWTGSNGFTGTGQTATATATTSGVYTYTVTVTDAVGCTAMQSTTVAVGEAPIATATPATVCVGETVTIEATTGGTNYAWSGPNFSTSTTTSSIIIPNAQLANAGEYSVTITGGSGCTGIATTLVTVNAPPTVLALVSSGTVCLGDKLILTASADPSANTTYEWTGPNGFTATGALITLNNISLTASGSYTVVATSPAGCSSSAVVTDPVTVTICCQDFGINVIVSNAHCGQSDGGATLTASGGTAPYTYLWSNGLSSSSVSTLKPGSYTATVTDAIGCSTTALVTIGNVEGPQLAVVSTTPAICLGTTGVASVTVSGGTAPYTYGWSTGATAATASGLVAGVYSVTVTDATGCSDVISVEIESTPGSLTSVIASTPSACGQATGGASVTVSGGTAAYRYVWNTGATTSSISGLASGVYSVIVTDANQCSVSATVSIDDLSGPSLAVSSTAVSCFGSSTGQAEALASGGTAPYTYAWSNGMTSRSVSGLAAGEYTVVLTDANGCVASETLTISQPSVMVAELSALTIACGSSTGDIILVSITGGTAPYSYLWSTGATTASLTAAAVGTHTVVITDANGCVANGSATLVLPTDCTPPCEPRNISLVALNPHCGQTDGVVTASLSGTVDAGATKVIVWRNSVTNAVIATDVMSVSGLSAGSYTVSLTLTTGSQVCSYSAVTSLTDVGSASLVVANTTASDCGVTNGSASLVISGTASFTVSYSGPSVGSLVVANSGPTNLSGLAAGQYSVIVRDANGCVATDNFVIESAGSSALNPIAIAGAASCTAADGSVAVSWSAVSGASSYSVTIGSQSTVVSGTSATFTGLSGGSYAVTVSVVGNANCGSSATTVTIPTTDGPALVVNATQPLCVGETGVITVMNPQTDVVYGLFTPTGTLVSTGASFTVGAGTYVVGATNSLCQSTTVVTIEAPSGINFNVSVLAGLCGEPGSLTVLNISGGNENYTTTVTGLSGLVSNLTSLETGSYTVTVSDSNGCSASQVVSVTTGESLTLTASVLQPTVCEGGVITLSANVNPAGSHTYIWSGPNFSTTTSTETVSISTATAANSGSYTVVVTSATCSYTAVTPVSVTVTSAPVAVENVVLSICNNETVDLAGYFPAGGTFSDHTSSNALTGSIFNGIFSQAGTFTIQYATAVTGCGSSTAIATIVVRSCSPPPCNFPISTAVVDANCGANDGRAQALIGGLPAGSSIGYNWSNGASGPQVTGLTAGVYSVTATVTNVPGATHLNGCIVVDTVNVNDIGGPVAIVSSLLPASCPSNNNGQVTLDIQSGSAPFVISYSGPSSGSLLVGNLGTQTITGLPAGYYSFRITSTVNGELCAGFVPVHIPRDDAGRIELIALPTNTTACGSPTGSIQYTASLQPSVMAPFTYLLNGQEVGTSSLPTFTLNNVVAGAYVVSVMSADGCRSDAVPVLIEDAGVPEIAGWSATDAECANEIGALVYAGGQSATTSYRIVSVENGGTVRTVPGNQATTVSLSRGLYAIIRTSADDTCTSVDTLNINAPMGLDFNVQYAAATCAPNGSAQTDGSIEVVQIEGGKAPYTVRILDSNNAVVSNANAVAGGNYVVEVTDVNGCAGIQQLLITIPDCQVVCPVLPLNTVVVDANCGASDGTAVASLAGLPAGSSVNYNWSNGQNGPAAAGLAAGVYSVTATITGIVDSRSVGCVYTGKVNVNEIGGPIPSALAVVPSRCSVSSGSVSLSITAGTAPYTVSWSGPNAVTGSQIAPNASSILIPNLAPGEYVFVVKGTGACQGLINVTVPVSTENDITISAIATEAGSCGASNGALVINVNGGSPNYIYTLNGMEYATQASPSLQISNLPAGYYSIGVTSSNGCTVRTSATIKTSNSPEVSGWTAQNAICADNTGTLIFAGGQAATASYRVLLGGTTLIATVAGNQSANIDVSRGVYVIERRDNGCVSSFQSLTITSPEGIDFNVQYAGETCGPDGRSNNDGKIQVVQISGGTAPYSVTVLNAQNDVVSDLNTLVAGQYTIRVSDVNSCTGVSSVLITVPPCPKVCLDLAFNTVVLDAQCGQADGIATAVLQGVPAGSFVTYEWSTGQNGASLSGLVAGVYSVTATVTSQDALYNGCKYIDVVHVNDIGAPIATIMMTTGATCTALNGSVILRVAGGTSPYVVSWTGAGTGSKNVNSAGQVLVDGLSAGDYVFTVTGNGSSCRSIVEVSVPQNNTAVMQVSVTPTNVSGCGGANGSIVVNVTGGTAPFLYVVNGYITLTTSSRTQTFPNLPAGAYTVMVSDANGCSVANTNVLINSIDTPPIAGWLKTDANCAGSNGTLVYTPAPGNANDQYVVRIAGSNTVVGQTAGNQPLTLNLTSGSYLITRTSSNSCIAQQTLTIEQADGIAMNLQYGHANCTSPASASLAIVQISGGTPFITGQPYSTTVTGVSGIVSNLTTLTAGSYTVTVGDANGCKISQVVSLTAGPSLTVVASAAPAVVCIGSPVSLSASATGGDSPITYVWTGPANFNGTGQIVEAMVSVSGSYTVTASSADGCVSTTVTSPVTATVCEPCVKPVLTVTGPVCNTANNTYSVDYVVSNGASVSANFGVVNTTINRITGIPTGQNVIITAESGCAETSSTVMAPTSCTLASGCTELVEVSVGQSVCVDGTSFVASVTATSSALVTVQGGVYNNGVITGVVGTNVTVVAAIPGCNSVTAIIVSPVNCTASCENPLLSLSGPVCANNSYSLRYIAPAGVTIVASAGIVNTGMISNIPLGVPVSITASDGNCPAQVVSVAAPIDCVPCSLTATVAATNPAICEGSPFVLSTSVNPAGNYTYVWSGPNFNTTTTGNTVTIANAFTANSGLYTVKVTSTDGCTALATTSVTVGSGISGAGKDVILSICNNETVNLVSYFTPTGGTFSEVTSSSALFGTTFSGQMSGAGVFKVQYTSAQTGCAAVSSVATIVVRDCSPIPPCDFPLSTAVVDASCGSSDGRAQVLLGGLPVGSTAGYVWSNGSMGPQVGGLTAGVYSVTATVTNVPGAGYLNGCVVVDSIQVNEVGGPVVVAQSVLPATCQGTGNNGVVTLNIQSGSGSFVITYTGPASGTYGAASTGTTSISNLPAGDYIFRITSTVNGKSCSGYIAVRVPRDDANRIQLLATPTSSTGCGTSTGRIEYAVTVQPGVTPPFTYLLNGQVVGTSPLPNFVLNNVAGGAYMVSVRSNSGCETAGVPVIIEDQNGSAITGWTANDARCPNDVGSLIFAGGQANTTVYRVISLDNGATVMNVSGASATTLALGTGSYAIRKMSTLDQCISIDTLNISGPAGLHFNVQYTAASCGVNGVSQADGSIRVVQIEGGTAPYTVRVLNSTNTTVSNTSALSAGNYIVEVRDVYGCYGIQQILISIPNCTPQCPNLPVDMIVVDASCGSNDGRATVSLGGLPTGSIVDYTWSNGQNGPTALGLSAGVYSVTATVTSTVSGNFIGCQYVKIVNVNDINGPVVELRAITASRCSVNTGMVSLSIASGSGPYTVSWMGPNATTGNLPAQNTSTFLIPNLAPGDYVFTVRGASSNCKGIVEATVPVTADQDMTLTAVSNNAGNCGANNGSIALNVTGGVPTYTFTLNGVQYANQTATSLIIPNLPAGVYAVGVTGTNSCSVTTSVIIAENGTTPVTGWTKQDANCAANTGSLIFAGGQAASVTYRILLSGSTPIATVMGNQSTTLAVPRGEYVIERKEGNCTSFQSLTISGTDGIDFNVQYTAETCAPGSFGNGDGSIRVVQITGGTAPYTVLVTNSQGLAVTDLNALLAGNYTVKVTDSRGCVGNSSVLITVPPCPKECLPLTFNKIVVDPQCGTATGTATVRLLGAPATVTYVWSNGMNGSSISGLTSGVYSVTATITSQDALYNGCTYVEQVNVNDIGGPVTELVIASPASCTRANGSVVLKITGSATLHLISWTGPVNGSQNLSGAGETAITGLPSGDYIFTVTGGASTCRSILNVTVPQSNTGVIQLTATTTNASSCGASNGSVTVSVMGGTAPFIYSVNGYIQISTSSRNQTIPDLPAGIYTVSVRDASGCAVAQQNVLINENGQQPIIGWTRTNALCASSSGTIAFNGSGGVGEQYTVKIAGTSTIVGQTAGNQALTLNLPGGTYLITRTNSTSCVAVQTLTITQPIGLDANIQFAQPTCTSLTSGSIASIQISGGTAPYTTTVTSATGIVTNLTALAAGSYTVTIGDANGCTISQVVSLSTGDCAPCFNAYVYLQGSLVNDIGVWPTNPQMNTAGEPLMRDDLRAQGIIPLQDPYRMAPYSATYTHVANPYSESIVDPSTTLADRGDNSVVDWVFLEFRSKSNPSVVQYTRSALVLRNGKIVDVDGSSCLRIDHLAANTYFVAVRHRNHLGVMTQTTRQLGSGAPDLTVDFRKLTPSEIWHDISDASALAVYGDVERRDIAWAPGYYALWAGDALRDRTTIYQGQRNDVVEVFNQIITYPGNALNLSSYLLNGYYSGDVNMNGLTIYQGQKNEPAIIYNIMIQHPRNFLNNPSFIIQEQLP